MTTSIMPNEGENTTVKDEISDQDQGLHNEGENTTVKDEIPDQDQGLYKCLICGKTYKKKAYLIHHITKHSKEPLRCETCGKCFPRVGELKRHHLTHTGERAHVCRECGKPFVLPEHLKAHMRTHMKTQPVARTSFQCPLCEKSFTHLRSLKTHTLLHTGERPYTCAVCGKSFARTEVLKNHLLTHSGAHPHKCKLCGKSFTQGNSLRTHMFKHTGERPYECHCGKTYTQSRDLKRHKLKSHVGVDDGGNKPNKTIKLEEVNHDFTHFLAELRPSTGEQVDNTPPSEQRISTTTESLPTENSLWCG